MYADDLGPYQWIRGRPSSHACDSLGVCSTLALSFQCCQVCCSGFWRISSFAEEKPPSSEMVCGWLSHPECDSQHHLGILRTVTSSSVLRTTERCSSGRSAFFCIKCCWIKVWLSTPFYIIQTVILFLHTDLVIWMRIVVPYGRRDHHA